MSQENKDILIVDNEKIEENLDEKELIKEILNIEDKTKEEENITNIAMKKILEFIRSPVREDSEKLIEYLMQFGDSLEILSSQSSEFNKILNEKEKISLQLLNKKAKIGLSEDQYPLGKNNIEDIKPTAFVYENDLQTPKELVIFSELLEEYISDVSKFEKLKQLYKEIKNLGKNPKNYVLNQKQKQNFNHLIESEYDDGKISRLELDMLLNTIKSSNFSNAKILEQRNNWYEAVLNSTKDTKYPDMRPLIKDVRDLKSALNVKLEQIPPLLTDEEKTHIINFLPALDEYYKDQLCAFSGGKSYLPLAKNLKNVQQSIIENSVAKNILEQARNLEYSMQRLYILHWVAESLMKVKYDMTLGKAIWQHRKKNSDDFLDLQEAVNFRNKIAHAGIIWEPAEFEIYIEYYEQGIEEISVKFDINLENFNLKSIDRQISYEEKKEKVEKYFSVNIKVIERIDKKLLSDMNTDKHKRLKEIFRLMKNNRVDVEESINDEKMANSIVWIYHNAKDLNKELENYYKLYFKNKFAKTYFGLSSYQELANLVDGNEQKVLYRIAMKQKIIPKLEKMDIDFIQKIQKQLKVF